MPSFVLSEITLRSNSAIAPTIENTVAYFHAGNYARTLDDGKIVDVVAGKNKEKQS
jgi:hypothetical protein